MPYLRVANVLDGRIDYSDVLSMNFTPHEQAIYGLRAGDILLNEGQSLELVGRCAIYGGSDRTYCFQNTLVRYRCGPDVLPRFAFYTFQRWLRIRRFVAVAKQTTSIAHLGADRFAVMAIPLPPIPEQQDIVEILESFDESIRSTERLLAKLDQRKRAVLQALVDHHDESNAEHSTVEQEFDVKAGITLGVHRRPRRRATPYLRVANVQRNYINVDDMAFLEASRGDLATYALRAGDLLVVEGHANPSEIGRCAMIQADSGTLVFQNHLFRLRPMRLNAEYANLWLNSNHARSYWRRMCATSSGLYTINSRQLRALPVRVPEAEEQERIAEIARSHDALTSVERLRLAKLQRIKQGLMEDLLTGRVRVKVGGDKES